MAANWEYEGRAPQPRQHQKESPSFVSLFNPEQFSFIAAHLSFGSHGLEVPEQGLGWEAFWGDLEKQQQGAFGRRPPNSKGRVSPELAAASSHRAGKGEPCSGIQSAPQ